MSNFYVYMPDVYESDEVDKEYYCKLSYPWNEPDGFLQNETIKKDKNNKKEWIKANT